MENIIEKTIKIRPFSSNRNCVKKMFAKNGENGSGTVLVVVL